MRTQTAPIQSLPNYSIITQYVPGRYAREPPARVAEHPACDALDAAITMVQTTRVSEMAAEATLDRIKEKKEATDKEAKAADREARGAADAVAAAQRAEAAAMEAEVEEEAAAKHAEEEARPVSDSNALPNTNPSGQSPASWPALVDRLPCRRRRIELGWRRRPNDAWSSRLGRCATQPNEGP